MAYCTRANIEDHVLAAYLDKADKINPGCVARHIADVAEEIDGALLQGGYELPLPSVPGKVRHINTVIAAWRAVGNITTLMDTEASAANDWIPLQTQYKAALADLALIRDGKLRLFPSVTDQETADDGLLVKTPSRVWTDTELEKF